ncbi:MAG: isochorismatase family cysteine hydrolase [Planctomycetota bacterium]|nr:isochorismatase family cysteine hydrolase [Planctomycetota bacterium]
MLTLKGKKVYSELQELIDPAHTALLIIDMCNEPTHQKGYFHNKGADLTAVADIVEPIARLAEAARKAGVLVVHAQQANLPDGRTDSPAWLRLKSIAYKFTEADEANDDYCIDGTWGAQINERLAPQPGDVVAKKQHASAFIGTNTDMILRSGGIETVVVTGTSSYGCVLNTVMDASCLDYYVVVGEDVVAGPNKALHAAALSIMRSRHDMAKAEDLLKIWNK